MEYQIIPKQEYIPPFDSQAIKVQHIEYFDSPYKKYENYIRGLTGVGELSEETSCFAFVVKNSYERS